MNASRMKCVSPQRSHKHTHMHTTRSVPAANEVCKRACVRHTQSMKARAPMNSCSFVLQRSKSDHVLFSAHVVVCVTRHQLDYDAVAERSDQLSADSGMCAVEMFRIFGARRLKNSARVFRGTCTYSHNRDYIHLDD